MTRKQQADSTTTRRAFIGRATAVGVAATSLTGLLGTATASNSLNPVLLVHGFMDTGDTPWWDVTEGRLKEVGYEDDQIHVLSLGDIPLTTVDSPSEYSKKVREAVESIVDDHDSRVDIVGHSMGGLDSRHYIEKRGGAAHVDNLVTLGTPHQGTYVAFLAYITPGGRDMVPGSPFLEDLNDGRLASSVEYTAIWSNFDELISPDEFAMLPEEERQSVPVARNVFVPWKGHVQLAYDEEVFETYAQYLVG